MSEHPPNGRRAHPRKTVGSKALLEWRGDRTQLDASREIGLHPSKISRLENGIAEPDLEDLITLRDKCGIAVDAWATPLAGEDLAVAS